MVAIHASPNPSGFVARPTTVRPSSETPVTINEPQPSRSSPRSATRTSRSDRIPNAGSQMKPSAAPPDIPTITDPSAETPVATEVAGEAPARTTTSEGRSSKKPAPPCSLSVARGVSHRTSRRSSTPPSNANSCGCARRTTEGSDSRRTGRVCQAGDLAARLRNTRPESDHTPTPPNAIRA